MPRRRRQRVDDSSVWVVQPAGKPYLAMRWIDPKTGKVRQRSTGTRKRREAERQAARLADQLAAGELLDETGWRQFRDRYEAEKLPGLSPRSKSAWITATNWLTELRNPDTLDEITSECLSLFAAELREQELSESSIHSYLGQIKAGLNWACEIGLLPRPPKFPRVPRAKGKSKLARSRAITGEEFDRICEAAKAERPGDWQQWDRFLRGLWECGFRVGELLSLSWDAGADLSVDTTGPYPMVRILAAGEKSHTDRFQPITAEFWAVCCETPERDRSGLVFPLRKPDGSPFATSTVVKRIMDIGRAAGVITSAADGKTATSHDIGRRALTTRLGAILSQSELAAWMRHESAETTRRYYYHAEAHTLAEKLWRGARDPARDPASHQAGESDVHTGVNCERSST